MTAPPGFDFVDDTAVVGDTVSDLGVEPEQNPLADDQPKFPPAIIEGVSDEKFNKLVIWLEEWINDLESDQSKLQDLWDSQEISKDQIEHVKSKLGKNNTLYLLGK